VIAEKNDDAPGVLLADLDMALVADARSRIPALKHDRTFSLDAVSAAHSKSGSSARAVA
jgi:predicted amidohydrolase